MCNPTCRKTIGPDPAPQPCRHLLGAGGTVASDLPLPRVLDQVPGCLHGLAICLGQAKVLRHLLHLHVHSDLEQFEACDPSAAWSGEHPDPHPGDLRAFQHRKQVGPARCASLEAAAELSDVSDALEDGSMNHRRELKLRKRLGDEAPHASVDRVALADAVDPQGVQQLEMRPASDLGGQKIQREDLHASAPAAHSRSASRAQSSVAIRVKNTRRSMSEAPEARRRSTATHSGIALQPGLGALGRDARSIAPE